MNFHKNEVGMMKKLTFIFIIVFVIRVFAQESTRFMVVGDPHNYSPSANFEQSIFYEIVLAALEEDVDFVFFAGDLVIRGFSDYAPIDSVLKDWRFVLDTLSAHNIRVFACRGNNDFNKQSWDSLFSGEYALPQNGPKNEKNITYALAYNNILFLALDQYTLSHRINQTWLDSILILSDKKQIFVAGHEPAFKVLHSDCVAAYPEERDQFWESLLAAGVKIYFSGHDHFYDHALIDDGDGNPNNDIHQVIVGTASSLHSNAEYDGDNGRWSPDSLFHARENGYVLVEVSGEQVQMIWKHRTDPNVYEDGGDSYIFLLTSIQKVAMANYFSLFQNYPNPFNPSTAIEFSLPKSEFVELKVYDILGKKISTLISEKLNQGNHTFIFDGKNLASGIYYYQLVAGDFKKVKKMILLH